MWWVVFKFRIMLLPFPIRGSRHVTAYSSYVLSVTDLGNLTCYIFQGLLHDDDMV